MRPGLLACTFLLTTPLLAQSAPAFAPPERIMAGDAPISVDVGHAAPFLYDLDGDGKRELLVGQFGEGKLRIYANAGTEAAPKYDKFTWLQAGGETAKVPTG